MSVQYPDVRYAAWNLVYFGTFVVTREDVQKYMPHHPQYTKANDPKTQCFMSIYKQKENLDINSLLRIY